MPIKKPSRLQTRIERAVEQAGKSASRRPIPLITLLEQPQPPVSEAVRSLADFQSPVSRRLLRDVRLVASHPRAAVLVIGESGAGKSQVARAVHDLSPRATQPFLKRDLACIPKDFAVSELFGHLRGAYTGSDGERLGAFALAHGGSLFLDELAKAELPVQGMLLNAIENGEIQPMGSERSFIVDVRVITAANVPLANRVRSGEFLDDLAARLEAFVVHVPPLRGRRSDVPNLVRRAIERAAKELGLKETPRVSLGLMELLVRYDWPHNLRELTGSVSRIVTEADGAAELRTEHIPSSLPLHAARSRHRKQPSPSEQHATILAADGNVSHAARLLGCHRSTLHRRFPPSTRGRGQAQKPPVAASSATPRRRRKRQSPDGRQLPPV